jgi:hypothetical protein
MDPADVGASAHALSSSASIRGVTR